MECPKCHKEISDESTVCPFCHKVLTLVCPNCKTIGESSVCENCGYIILEKCTKCGKTISTSTKKCKCGFSSQKSIAYQECETDEFTSVTIKFLALKEIRKLLGSKELYKKFKIKLKNLFTTQIKNFDGKVIIYDDTYVINFNKELSFPTSANKAIRLSIKIANAFAHLNEKILTELGTSLKLNISILKKDAEDLLLNKDFNSKVKPLSITNSQKYLRGMQIILDQYVQDVIAKEYKTDSLYSLEENGNSLILYELLLEKYVLPPNKENDGVQSVTPNNLQKNSSIEPNNENLEFNIFDINAKCSFKKACTSEAIELLDSNKIVCLRSEQKLHPITSDILNFYAKKGINVLYANCSDETGYKPWGIFEKLFKEYYKLSFFKGLIPENLNTGNFSTIKHIILGNPRKASTPEDARFGYLEDFARFLKSLKNYTVIIDGFEKLDDSSIQALTLYFDNYKHVIPNFVFITSQETPAHSRIKSLLRTELYTEVSIQKSDIELLLSELKDDASDFIKSFYSEKIKEYFNGSNLYFNNVLKFLEEKDIIISFENKLIIRNNNSVLIPADLQKLIKARLKEFSKNTDASMMLAYSALLGERIDTCIFSSLGIQNVEACAKLLEDAGFITVKDKFLYINNYNLTKPVILSSLKNDIINFLVKNIIAKIGKVLDSNTLALLMGKIKLYKEEYMLLWKNSQFAMIVGDYDAYLKNSLGFLSIINQIKNNLPQTEIEKHKKEVYENILLSLYAYSPAKIYSIENILLADAIKKGDNECIIKLSNLMLQGALLSSNYKDALSLLHNILERIPSPTLINDGVINKNFLLLSLVNIEILFNIGDFQKCIEIAEEILNILTPDSIESIRPAGFSTGLFVNHLMDTFRLASLAMLIKCDSNLDSFFEKIKIALNKELSDKDCIMAIKNFTNGKIYAVSDTENATPYSKIVNLILQEISTDLYNPKIFAQNIFQAKLLAEDIELPQLTLLCELLIGYAYANEGINKKAENIFNDVLAKSELSALFITKILSEFFIADLHTKSKNYESALLIINNSLALIQNKNNEAVLLKALFERLFIKIAKEANLPFIDIETEERKLALMSQKYDISLITGVNLQEV